jgi:4-oxalomesaconate hydratase
MDYSNERLMVVSAHAADFVWRAGGALALYSSRGARTRVLCLSYGERGESQGLWKKDGMTLERVKEIRHQEATKAAEVLGAEIRCFDAGDYPLGVTEALTEEIVQEIRSFRPTCVMTHTPVDPYNGDHAEASKLTLNARIYAQAMGYPSPHAHLGAPPVFYFEPHQTEMCSFKPDVILDITPVLKPRSMPCTAWMRRHISGITTPMSPGGEARRVDVTQEIPPLFTPRPFNVSIHRSQPRH